MGPLPPSSRSWVLPAARAATLAPVATDPMKPTPCTPGWPATASPTTGPGPGRKLNTPAGRPAAVIVSASSAQQAEVVGAGTQITTLPAASAGANSSAPIVYGHREVLGKLGDLVAGLGLQRLSLVLGQGAGEVVGAAEDGRRHGVADGGALERRQRGPGRGGGAGRGHRVVDVRAIGDGHRGERLSRGRADGRGAARAARPPGAAHAQQVLTHRLLLSLPPSRAVGPGGLPGFGRLRHSCARLVDEAHGCVQALAQSLPSPARVSGSIRNSGPETDSAATQAPAGSNTGAATATSPSSSSATAVA